MGNASSKTDYRIPPNSKLIQKSEAIEIHDELPAHVETCRHIL